MAHIKHKPFLVAILILVAISILYIDHGLIYLLTSCTWRPPVQIKEASQSYADVFYLQYLAPDSCAIKLAEGGVYLIPLTTNKVRNFIRCEETDGVYARVDYKENPYGHFYNVYETMRIWTMVHFFVYFIIVLIAFIKQLDYVWKCFVFLYTSVHVALMVMFAVDISANQLKCDDIDDDMAMSQLLSTLTLPIYFFIKGIIGTFVLIRVIFNWKPYWNEEPKSSTDELNKNKGISLSEAISEEEAKCCKVDRYKDPARLLAFRRDSQGVIRVSNEVKKEGDKFGQRHIRTDSGVMKTFEYPATSPKPRQEMLAYNRHGEDLQMTQIPRADYPGSKQSNAPPRRYFVRSGSGRSYTASEYLRHQQKSLPIQEEGAGWNREMESRRHPNQSRY